MKKTLRLAMAQINVIVGDIEGNTRKIADWTDRAIELQADVVTFPELALTGYPPEDLLLKPQFIVTNDRLELDLDPNVVEFSREPQAVGIAPLRR